MERTITRKEMDLIVHHIKILEDKVKTIEEKINKIFVYLEKKS